MEFYLSQIEFSKWLKNNENQIAFFISTEIASVINGYFTMRVFKYLYLYFLGALDYKSVNPQDKFNNDSILKMTRDSFDKYNRFFKLLSGKSSHKLPL